MAVQDLFLLLDASDDMDVAVWNYDCFWVVRKIVQVAELLNLVGFVLEVEEVAVSLLDGEDGDFLDLVVKI